MDNEAASEKSIEPTEQKLARLRGDGEIARFPDVYTTMAFIGVAVSIVFVGESTLDNLGSLFVSLLTIDAHRGYQIETTSDSIFFLRRLISSVFSGLATFFLIPFVLVFLAILSHRGFTFSLKKLNFKVSRVSIIKNAGSKFGLSGLFDFAKNTAKLFLYSALFIGFLLYFQEEIYATMQLTAHQAIIAISYYCAIFFAMLVACMGVISVLDGVFKYFEHIRKNRMTRQELLDENKESEGDPHMKQERRNRAQSAATANMLRDVSSAEVVIVNPTHYAVALSWSREEGSAPKCVAKGVDQMALRIREIARDSSVAIFEDPKTARALYAFTEVGDEIAPDYYEAVAAAIQFAERMSTKVAT